MYKKEIADKGDLVKVIDALEVLGKEYTIKSIKRPENYDWREGSPARWVVEEEQCGPGHDFSLQHQ